MIIPFTGHTILKQYCPRKPDPHGLKFSVLASPKGHILNFVFHHDEELLMSSVARINLMVGGFNNLTIGEAGVQDS